MIATVATLTLTSMLSAGPANAKPVTANDFKGQTLAPVATINEATKPPEVGQSATLGPASSMTTLAPAADSLNALSTPTYPNDTLECRGWGYVAAKENSYITGNCGPGWEFDRRQKSGSAICNSSGACYYWHGGFIQGAFQGCGWIRDVDIQSSSSTTHTACDPGSIDKQQCDYIWCPNGVPQVYGGTDDGRPAYLTAGCAMMANIRPWLDGQHITGASTGPFSPTADYTRFKIRYVARYQVDGFAFYMVHDTRPAAGALNWGFMAAACLTPA
jgi:hypothetical protein